MSIDWSRCSAVESVSDKVGGAWVLKDTRMPVRVILDSLEAGASIDDIMQWYAGLDRDQVEAAVGFYVQNRAHEK